MKQTILVAIFTLPLFHAFPAQASIFDDVLEYLKPAELACARQVANRVVSSEQGQGENQQNQSQTEEEPDCE